MLSEYDFGRFSGPPAVLAAKPGRHLIPSLHTRRSLDGGLAEHPGARERHPPSGLRRLEHGSSAAQNG